MNRDEQGDYSNNKLERQGGLFLTGEAAPLKVKVRGVSVFDSASDGIYCYKNLEADISDIDVAHCFRAGLGASGNGTKVRCAHGSFIDSGPDIEPGLDSQTVDITLDTIDCDRFKIALTPNSRCLCSNITHTGGLWYLFSTNTSEFECVDSTFVVPLAKRCEIRLAGRSLFRNCKWETPTGAPKLSNCINVLWDRPGSPKVDQALTFDECTISGSALLGIDAGIDEPQDRNQLSILNTKILGTDRGAAAQGTAREKRGLPWILTGSTHNGEPLR